MNTRYIRLERSSTGSFLDYPLDTALSMCEIEQLIAEFFPGWELVNTCALSPEED